MGVSLRDAPNETGERKARGLTSFFIVCARGRAFSEREMRECSRCATSTTGSARARVFAFPRSKLRSATHFSAKEGCFSLVSLGKESLVFCKW